MSPVLRLALLICDHLVPAFRDIYGDYRQIYTRFLSSSLARITSEVTYTLDAYDVVIEMAYPPDDVHYDGLLITGSRASAHEDVEWINKLIAYVGRIITEKPSLKIFGICFGHQIVARALGGSCTRNSHGWEVSVTSVQLTPLGKAIFGADELDIQQMHADHVPTYPPGAHLLGSSGITPNHGMVIFNTESPSAGASVSHVDLESIHVFTVQGHPEFTQSIMTTLLNSRVLLLGEQLVDDGLVRAGGIPGRCYPDGLTCDGVSKVGRVIWGVLGVA